MRERIAKDSDWTITLFGWKEVLLVNATLSLTRNFVNAVERNL
jgi:hypothetical protein